MTLLGFARLRRDPGRDRGRRRRQHAGRARRPRHGAVRGRAGDSGLRGRQTCAAARRGRGSARGRQAPPAGADEAATAGTGAEDSSVDVSGTDPTNRRARPLLSRRATVLTGIAVAIFAVVFLRLWYLQVLSGDDFREQANDNRVREVRVQAPRGNIVDRDGKVLVANRTELALYVQPRDLPKPGTDGALGRDAGPRADHRRQRRRRWRHEIARVRRGVAGEPRDPGPGPRRRQDLLPAREPATASRA